MNIRLISCLFLAVAARAAAVGAVATFERDASKVRLEAPRETVSASPLTTVRARSAAGPVTLFANGLERSKAQPGADGVVTFRNIRLKRGITDFRVEAGGRWFDATSVRYGTTEAATGTVVRCASDRTSWFREARFGMSVNWGLYAIPAKGEWTLARDEWRKGEYESLQHRFDPKKFDPREWARLAKAAGMGYAVFTSRHYDGFCLFDSHFTDYKVTNSPYGRDVLKEVLEAFRAEGLRVGISYSLPDWHHPGYSDPETPQCLQTGRSPTPSPAQVADFRRLIRSHVNQLTTEYGKIDLMFFDYTSGYKAEEDPFERERLLEICRKNQPEMLVNDRLSYFKDTAPDYDYYTPTAAVPNFSPLVRGRSMPWEASVTLNDHWGACATDANWKSSRTIVSGLVGCVSRDGNLLLNVGPDADGVLPERAVSVLRELAAWNAKNGEAVRGCGESARLPPFGCVYTQKGAKTLYCHVLAVPPGDLILDGLDGKTSKLTLLRTGDAVETVAFRWIETLRPGELRIRPRGLEPGDVIRIELK